MRQLIPVVCLNLLLSGCGGGDAAEVVPPISAIISGAASDAIVGDTLRLSAKQSVTASASAVYSWAITEQPAGSRSSLVNANAVDVQFIADLAGDYKLTLTVTDGGQSKTTSALIQVAANQIPQLKLVTPELKNLLINKAIRLDAAASKDPELRPLQYQWQVLAQPQGSTLTLAQQSQIDITPIVSGDYRFKLTLSDGVNSVSDEVAFTAYKSVLTLKADASSSLSAAQQLTAFFGEGSLDVPSTHEGAEHLSIANDDVGGAHFVFTVHLSDDGDRDVPLKMTDRQRVEVKSYSQSAESLVCRKDDRMELDFNFKTDDIDLSPSFTHVFQLKGKADTPLFTLSVQDTQKVKALRLNHVQGGTKLEPLAAVPWEQVKNNWLAISMRFSCGEQGYLEVQVRDKLKPETIYLNEKHTNLKMWQDQSNEVYGIKTGLYRKVKANCQPIDSAAELTCEETTLRKEFSHLEDKVRLGDMTIRKL